MWFPDFNWAIYDREFRQQAAATSAPEWSVLDNTPLEFGSAIYQPVSFRSIQSLILTPHMFAFRESTCVHWVEWKLEFFC